MTLRRNLFWFVLLLICGLAALSSSALIVIQSLATKDKNTNNSSSSSSETEIPNDQTSKYAYESNENAVQHQKNTQHMNDNKNTNTKNAGKTKINGNEKDSDKMESNEDVKRSPYTEKNISSSLGLGMSLDHTHPPTPYFPERGLNFDTRETDKNIQLALFWLRDHQDHLTGSWSADNFNEQCKINSPSPYGSKKFDRDGICANLNGTSDAGLESHTILVTGLAILAYLGAGYTHEEGEFRLTVKKGLRYLLSIQLDSGCFGSKDDKDIMYNHIVCSKAIIDAYIMTDVRKLKAPAQMAIDFLAEAQTKDPEVGWLGWGFNFQDKKSNSFITSWVVMTLYAAKNAKLNVPDHCFEGAQRFLSSVTSHPSLDKTGDKYPRTGLELKIGETTEYNKTPLLDAMNIFARRLMGTDIFDLLLQWQTELISHTENRNMPSTVKPENIDFLYWHFASLAMYQMGDTCWYQWKKTAFDSIIKLQRLEDDRACTYGSWDPIDTWGSTGGRVYATAINALTLETEYRFSFIR